MCYIRPTNRHAVGHEVADSGQSGKTKAEDAANLINESHICRIHQTYKERLEIFPGERGGSLTEGLFGYGQISKAD